jgi:hypothetical protein
MADPEDATMDLAISSSVPQKQYSAQESLSTNEVITQLLGTVSNLKASVDTLQTSVSRLQNENTTLRQDLTTLQQNSGLRFPQFKKLPPELRRLVHRHIIQLKLTRYTRQIWQLACSVAQIHIVSDKSVSQSQITSVINSCHEARTAVLSLKMNYFLFSTRTHYSDNSVVQGTVRHYFNADLDTLWFVRHGEGVLSFTEDLQWVCGKCNDIGWPRDSYRPCGEGCFFSYRSGDGPAYFQSVAINLYNYLQPGDHDMFNMESLDLIWRSQVKNILLVVESYGSFEMERDVVFVPPAERPWPTLRKMTQTGFIKSILEDPDLRSETWEGLEAWMEDEMEIFKDQREVEREAALECEYSTLQEMHAANRDIAGLVTWADLEDDDSELRDLSDWEVPTVRFVEARKRGGPWNLRPPEKMT